MKPFSEISREPSVNLFGFFMTVVFVIELAAYGIIHDKKEQQEKLRHEQYEYQLLQIKVDHLMNTKR